MAGYKQSSQGISRPYTEGMDNTVRDFKTSWLSKWIKAADEYQALNMINRTQVADGHWEEHRAEVQAREDWLIEITPRVLMIVQTEKPEVSQLYDEFEDWLNTSTGRRIVVEVRGIIRSKENTEKFLGGDAPRLSADTLHPKVWNAAKSFWNDGHRTTAVLQACAAINVWVQELVGRKDLSDYALMAQAFNSSEPEQGKPRLRWPGDPSDRTVQSMNKGIMQYAMGCFQAIRNPSAHTIEQTEENLALIQLSALSLLATWIDGCELVSVNKEPPF